MTVHIFNIPAASRHIADVDGDRFRASIYETPDGQIAAFVEREDDATPMDLASEQMNTRIHEAARRTGRRLSFMIVRDVPPGSFA